MNTNILIIIIGIPIIIGIWIMITFNSMVRLKNDAKKSFAGIDVQLKRRTDLIPNLINVVKGYAKHEKEVFENVTKARTDMMSASSNGNVKDIARSENILGEALKSVFAVAEAYPDLKANQNFLKLQEELTETEDQIAASRRIYNENVTYLNTKLETFPNNVIGSMFNFKGMDLFEIDVSQKETIKIQI